MSTTTVITRPLSNDIPLEIFKGNTLQHTPTPTQNDTAIDRITSVQDDSEASQHDPELSADEEARSQLARSLPPIDGGKRAWFVKNALAERGRGLLAVCRSLCLS